MPQLMPLFWNLSLFMITYIIMIMTMMYFMKLLDYNLIYLDMNNKILYNKFSLILFKW